MLKKILLSSLSIFLGGIFIFSAYTKLYPIEPFELTFVDIGVANWRTAPFIARLFISFEFFIGALFILNLNIKFTSKLSVYTLLAFCFYLLGIIILSGNKGNCGCFGNYWTFTPLQGIIKNIVLLIISFILYKYHLGFNYKKTTNYVIGFLIMGALSVPHILNYVDMSYSEAYLNSPKDHFKLELDSLYKYATINQPPKELSKQKRLIVFMSLTCPHCRIAAKKIRLMVRENPKIPVYFVLNGDNDKLKPFFEDTKTEFIPYCMLLGKSFVYLAGTNMPTIYLVNNGIVENRVDYLSLDQKEIENWMSK